MTFHITLETAEDGWIVAECPALPGCISQGKDEEEAINNIREAITAWMWAEDQKAMKSLPEKSSLLTCRCIEAGGVAAQASAWTTS
jgi:predicted RNase H-like HicB family nuclease